MGRLANRLTADNILEMPLSDYQCSTSIVPCVGWTFQQPLNGTIITLSGSNAKTLVKAVEDFRIGNNIKAGNIEKEIAKYLRGVSPQNAMMSESSIKASKPQKSAPIIERIRNWFAVNIPKQPKFTDDETATKRANICASCPQNIRWKVDGCGKCNDDIDYRTEVFRAGATTPSDADLRACRCYNVELRSFVHLDIAELPLPNPEAPAICWVHEQPNPDRQ